MAVLSQSVDDFLNLHFKLAETPGFTELVFKNARANTTLELPIWTAWTNGLLVASGATDTHETLAGGAPLRVYPNPLNPSGIVEFELPAPSPFRLAIYDASGRLVWRVQESRLHSGTVRVRWNGEDGRGIPVASGVYHIRVDGSNWQWGARALLLK
jgi:hypothetical protein